MNKTTEDFIEALEQVTDALEKIRENPDGGKVVLKVDDGRELIFTMPPLAERKPPTSEDLDKMIKKLEKFGELEEKVDTTTQK